MALQAETMIKRQQVLADFGEFAIRSDDLDEVLTEACRLVAAALGTVRAKVLEIQEDGQELLVRAGVGWNADIVGRVRLQMNERSSETYSIKAGGPVVSQDIRKDDRFGLPDFMQEAGVVALVNVPIFVPGERPYGVLQVDDTQPRDFGDDEIHFLRTYATILGPVIDRLHLIEERRQTRRQLADDFAAMEELQRVTADIAEQHEPAILYERIVEVAALLMHADAASLHLLDRRARTLRLCAWRGFHAEAAEIWAVVDAGNGSACGKALRDGTRTIMPDIGASHLAPDDERAYARSNLQAVQSTPLRASIGHIVGMLSTYWRERHRPTEHELRFFDLLARLSADLIERVQASEQLRIVEELRGFLLKLSDALRPLSDPSEIQSAALRIIGEHLGASRAYYVDIDEERNAYVVTQGYADGVSPLMGAWSIGSRGQTSVLAASREVVVVNDVATDPRFTDAERAAHSAQETRALVGIPLVKDDKLVAALGVHHRTARNWEPADIILIQEAAERSWASLERGRAEAALRESEQRIAAAFESVPVGVAVIDIAGKVVIANQEYRRFLPGGVGPSLDAKAGSR